MPSSRNITADDLISGRTWLITAICVVGGGWFGAQRFYLGRYASGVMRLALFVVAVYCGSRIIQSDGAMIRRMTYMVLVGAGFDLLMMVVGPALMRRRMTPTSIFSPILLIPKHPAPRFDGTWLTLPAVVLLLIYLSVNRQEMALNNKLIALGFIGCSVLLGVYWIRDCIRVLYWRNLTDHEGRLPL